MKVKYFELAKRLSKKSDHHRHHIGCVIVKKNMIIGFGHNQMKSHPRSPHAWKMLHAELHAILGLLPSELRGAEMYVYREHRNGTLALAKPCPGCQSLIRDCGIKTVYYSDEGKYSSYDVI